MSTYMVTDKTMNIVVEAVFLKRGDGSFKFNYRLKTLAKILRVKPEELTKQLVGNELLKMNRRAVNCRYRHRFRAQKYRVPIGNIPTHPIQRSKSLHNLCYQCFEGDVPQTKLLHWLEEFTARVDYDYLESLPEYNDAKWSCG